jgi:hypothetical protein
MTLEGTKDNMHAFIKLTNKIWYKVPESILSFQHSQTKTQKEST